MAKNPAAKVGGGNQQGRPPADFYETPPMAVHSLLDVERFEGRVWEPACGKGAISQVLKEHDVSVVSSDKHDYGYGEPDIDFLRRKHRERYLLEADNIITNPPFKLAVDFALLGCDFIRKTKGKLALLNRLVWLESAARKPMFESTPLARVHVFSRRLPMMHRPGYKKRKAASMVAFAWFVWEWDHEGPPTIGWIDWGEHVNQTDR